MRVGLVLLSALYARVEVNVSGANEKVEIKLTAPNGTNWPLVGTSADRSQQHQQFVGAVASGSYALHVSSSAVHRALAARQVSVGPGNCTWVIDVPPAFGPGTQPEYLRKNDVAQLPSEQASSRSWLLPGIWLGSVAGLTALSVYAHGRASSLTSELDRCEGDLATCRFDKRRRDIEHWDNINEDSAYWALAVGGFGLALGGIVWLIEAQAGQVGSAASVSVGVNHVSLDVRY